MKEVMPNTKNNIDNRNTYQNARYLLYIQKRNENWTK